MEEEDLHAGIDSSSRSYVRPYFSAIAQAYASPFGRLRTTLNVRSAGLSGTTWPTTLTVASPSEASSSTNVT